MTNGPAPASQPKRKRRWSFVVTALVLGIVSGLVVVELAFRLFWTLPPWFAEFQQAGMYVPTADGDIALQPGYRGTLRVDVETTVAINSLGMRGPECASKQSGERRLLMLGDSMVWGYGVQAEQALPARIEVELRAAGLPVMVGNGGVPAYGSKHAVAHMARLDEPFGADAFVVCGCLGNDALDDTNPERTVYAGLMLQGVWARLVGTSFRARLMYRSRAALWVESWLATNCVDASLMARLPWSAEELALTAGLPKDRTHAGLFLDVIDEATTWVDGAAPVIPRLLGILRTSLQRAKEVAGRRLVVFLVLPTSWQVIEPKRRAHLQELGFDPPLFERGLAQHRWRTVARELGMPCFDATPILAAEPDPEQLFISDGGHLSVRGHEVVGKWFATELAPLLR